MMIGADCTDTARIARACVTLLDRLGYEYHGAHGGDIGSGISLRLGVLKPDRLVGVHVLQICAFPSGAPAEMATLTADEQKRLGVVRHYESEHSGYAKMQATRPQTLSYALADSPVGQLAWIVDFYERWGENATPVDRDNLLTIVTLYWLIGTAASGEMHGGPPSERR